MFLENSKVSRIKKGWIEVICGSMFSGKTEELIRRLRRAKIARQKAEIFKPFIDTRYDKASITSHDLSSIPSTSVSLSNNILLLAQDADVIGIDEAQFFDDQLPHVCTLLANSGIRVIVAGLDMDYSGKPFGPLPYLMAISDYVTKVHAVCMNCGDLAHYSFRTCTEPALVLVGEKESYQPLCRSCYNEAMLNNAQPV